jgi:hypothetical protein
MSTKTSNFFGVLRTVVMVTLVAALLWLMAEAQMVKSQSTSLQIVLLPTSEENGQTVVRASTQELWERTVEITLEGATSELDRAVRQFGGRFELALGSEIPTSPGTHDLDLRSLLRQHAVIQQSGVRVAEVTPETVSVEVDELISVDLPVRIQIPSGVEIQGSPQAEPAVVKLVGPSRIVNEMQSSGLDAVAQVDDEMIDSLTPGRSEMIRGVLVELLSSSSDQWETSVDPLRVDVRILLRSLTETLDLPPMPVQVMVAPDEIGRYVIEIAAADRDVVAVQVSGPGEAIEQIRNNSIVPTAFLALSLDQLESRVTSAVIEVHGLPEGVTMAGPPRTVQLTIRLVEPADQPAGTSAP